MWRFFRCVPGALAVGAAGLGTPQCPEWGQGLAPCACCGLRPSPALRPLRWPRRYPQGHGCPCALPGSPRAPLKVCAPMARSWDPAPLHSQSFCFSKVSILAAAAVTERTPGTAACTRSCVCLLASPVEKDKPQIPPKQRL